MQINELKAEVVRNGMTLTDVADRIGIQRSTLWRRFNEPEKFTVLEIKRIKEILKLSGERVMAIFFS